MRTQLLQIDGRMGKCWWWTWWHHIQTAKRKWETFSNDIPSGCCNRFFFPKSISPTKINLILEVDSKWNLQSFAQYSRRNGGVTWPVHFWPIKLVPKCPPFPWEALGIDEEEPDLETVKARSAAMWVQSVWNQPVELLFDGCWLDLLLRCDGFWKSKLA